MSPLLLLILSCLGDTIAVLSDSATSTIDVELIHSNPWQMGRQQSEHRSLHPGLVSKLYTNSTLRREFCITCRPRKCKRRALQRRCASESSLIRKCICCKFCRVTWRQRQSIQSVSKASNSNLVDIVAAIQQRLPMKTARICQRHNVRCSTAQLCLLNIQNLPVCRCLPEAACGRGTNKTMVCATNNVTYLSSCHLLVSACRLRETFEPANTGPCRSSDAPKLLVEQTRIFVRRKDLRGRKRMLHFKRRDKRRDKRERRHRFRYHLLNLLKLNQRERRRLLREMKKFQFRRSERQNTKY